MAGLRLSKAAETDIVDILSWSQARFGTTAGVWSAWHGWGGVWPWMGADLLFWPGRERLQATGLSEEGTVPGLEVQIAVGLGIGLFP